MYDDFEPVQVTICRGPHSLLYTKAEAHLTYIMYEPHTWHNPEWYECEFDIFNHRGQKADYLKKLLTRRQKAEIRHAFKMQLK